MKKLVLILLVLGAFACTQEKGYKIEVNLEGAEGTIVLQKRGDGKLVTVDSADFVDNIAVLEGEVTIPEDYFLSIKDTRNRLVLFVENAEVKITGKVDSMATANVEGSETHGEFKTIQDKLNEMQDEYMGIYRMAQEANAAGDTTKSKELMEKVQAMYEVSGQYIEDYIANNPASYVTPFFLRQISFGKSVEQLDSILVALDPKLDASATIVQLKERVEKLKKVAVGQIALDFTQNDTEGNPVKLSEIYSANEYTLVDFWAAWCGPCRRENPNIVAVYNDYKDKGFTVFGVSLDNKKEDWLKAIEDDGLPWKQVSDLKGWKNEAAQLYAINSIPSSLLVDKTGKIIAKNLREEALREKIAELLD